MDRTVGVRCLYLSYDGLLDPLGRSQVVPYLERFARGGIKLFVVSFEKTTLSDDDLSRCRRHLRSQRIHWLPLRYHKRPPVMSTVWDLLQGLVATRKICSRWRPDIVHARGYVVALLALWVTHLTRARFLFDLRGFWPEQRVEGGLWKTNGMLYRTTKWCERRFFQAADGIVILSEAGKNILDARLAERGIQVPTVAIPTCVNLNRFTLAEDLSQNNGKGFKLVHIGSLEGWYALDAMSSFFSLVQEQIPDAEWELLTYSTDGRIDQKRFPVDPRLYRIHSLPHEEVPGALRHARASLCLVKPVSSARAACPTKVGESLACGVPIVITAGVGDCDTLIERERVGVVVRTLSHDSYRLAVSQLRQLLQEGEELRRRCRRVAERYFDLEKGVEKYLALYREMLHG